MGYQHESRPFLVILKYLLIITLLPLSGCQFKYILDSGYHQAQILRSRVDIRKIVESNDTPKNVKDKLNLALKVRKFAVEKIGLNESRNYTTYVNLNRPYVTYIVRAAPKYELKPYLWSFPLVGSVPYKGYFKLEGAQKEALKLKNKGLDTFIRGVSAYSTLGWFEDPILSSMLSTSDHSFVNTLIHEMVHATLFIKDHVSFNERLATFIGNKATEEFYKDTEGIQSSTIQKIMDESHDDKLFSSFITNEIEKLEVWYEDKTNHTLDKRSTRFKKIKNRFISKIKNKMKTSKYHFFEKLPVNNAYILQFKTYVQNLSIFEEAYKKLGQDLKRFLKYCKTLENSENPEKDLEIL